MGQPARRWLAMYAIYYGRIIRFIDGEEFFVKEPKAPQGTMALLALFALLTLAFWANAYFIVLSRGVTQ